MVKFYISLGQEEMMLFSCHRTASRFRVAAIFSLFLLALIMVVMEQAAAAITVNAPTAANENSITISWSATGERPDFHHWAIYYAKFAPNTDEYEQPFVEDYGYYLDEETGWIYEDPWDGPWQRPDWGKSTSSDPDDREGTITGLQSNRKYNVNIGFENNPVFYEHIYYNSNLIADRYDVGYDNLQNNVIDGQLDFWFPIFKYFDFLPPDPQFQDLNPYYGANAYLEMLTAPSPPTLNFF